MSIEVYYFSGTGNSYAVARDISKKLSGNLIDIPSIINNENYTIDAEQIGIVFPVYHQGVPNIVRRFVSEVNLDHKYVFAVCTYGDSPGISLEYLRNFIKHNGGKLSVGFAVQMPYNYISPSINIREFFSAFKLRKISLEKQYDIFHKWQKRIDDICVDIISQEKGVLETRAGTIEHLIDRFNLRNTLQKNIWLRIAGCTCVEKRDISFYDSIKLFDYGFWSDSKKCTSCGICKMVCPVSNIHMTEGSPGWMHHCEQCFACLQWCPEEAIQFRNGTADGNRYHHPDVKLSEMIKGNRGK